MKDTISTIKDRLKKGESALDIAKDYEMRARADTRNIFREVFDDIESQARFAQELIDTHKDTPLTAVPIAIKDNILFAGHKAGASSKMLESYVASYDSKVVSNLKKQGAIIVGRTNMDEFAMGSSTENSAYGVTKNPVDESRVPGGSSGGSSAAVSAGLCVLSLGSDTGGSIRQPAAFCGVVGLLPTYGSVSRHGLMAMGSSLDVIGPFAHTVNDSEILFNAICGQDLLDSTSFNGVNVEKKLKKKIAIPKGLFEGGGASPDVISNFENTVSNLKNEGFEIDEIDLPHFKNSLAVYYILMPAEVSSNLARFDGVRYGTRIEGDTLYDLYSKTRGNLFGEEVRRRLLLGTYVLSHGYYDAYYNKAISVRKVITNEIIDALSKYDAIITPTTPTEAFKIGEKSSDPLSLYLSDLYTVPANIAQVPAISVPSGVAKNGLPLGIQFIGAKHDERTLFELAKIVERLR